MLELLGVLLQTLATSSQPTVLFLLITIALLVNVFALLDPLGVSLKTLVLKYHRAVLLMTIAENA